MLSSLSILKNYIRSNIGEYYVDNFYLLSVLKQPYHARNNLNVKIGNICENSNKFDNGNSCHNGNICGNYHNNTAVTVWIPR